MQKLHMFCITYVKVCTYIIKVGIPTPRASPYVARSIPPVFSCMGVQVASLTVTTMCDFERGGATKQIIGSS